MIVRFFAVAFAVALQVACSAGDPLIYPAPFSAPSNDDVAYVAGLLGAGPRASTWLSEVRVLELDDEDFKVACRAMGDLTTILGCVTPEWPHHAFIRSQQTPWWRNKSVRHELMHHAIVYEGFEDSGHAHPVWARADTDEWGWGK